MDARQELAPSQDLQEEINNLRALQAFRVRNACALLALPSTSSTSPPLVGEREGVRIPGGISASNIEGSDEDGRQEPGNEEHYVLYHLRHFTCELSPGASCKELNHAREGHPSDEPPSVRACDVNIRDMLPRLIIPHTAPTSIRCTDRHHAETVGAREKHTGGSLSIAHQRLEDREPPFNSRVPTPKRTPRDGR